jgi:hypothetical protein
VLEIEGEEMEELNLSIVLLSFGMIGLILELRLEVLDPILECLIKFLSTVSLF